MGAGAHAKNYRASDDDDVVAGVAATSLSVTVTLHTNLHGDEWRSIICCCYTSVTEAVLLEASAEEGLYTSSVRPQLLYPAFMLV